MSNRTTCVPDTIEYNEADTSTDAATKSIEIIWDDDKIEKVSYITISIP